MDPVVTFLGRSAPKKLHGESSVPATEEGVRMLASCGAWRAAASLSERLLSQSHPVDKLLRLRWSYIVALLKLREVARAEREMTLLGDLHAESWQYEGYPGIYPGCTGSMVPYSLHLLHALLPAYSGKFDHALARLYTLLASEAEAASGSAGAGGGLARRTQVVLAIVNVLCALHDYPNAATHLEQIIIEVQSEQILPEVQSEQIILEVQSEQIILEVQSSAAEEASEPGATDEDEAAKYPSAPKSLTPLLALLARVYLQLGNLAAAADALQRLEASLGAPDASVVLRVTRGMLQMARSQYSTALAEFEAARALEPANALAANNAAVCQLYCGALTDAIGTLEAQLKADPCGMHEVIVSNLSALYQMREGGGAAKEVLERLVVATSADDFDMGVLKLDEPK
jgi:tetratricopeptide (TPR) repeat protein